MLALIQSVAEVENPRFGLKTEASDSVNILLYIELSNNLDHQWSYLECNRQATQHLLRHFTQKTLLQSGATQYMTKWFELILRRACYVKTLFNHILGLHLLIIHLQYFQLIFFPSTLRLRHQQLKMQYTAIYTRADRIKYSAIRECIPLYQATH